MSFIVHSYRPRLPCKQYEVAERPVKGTPHGPSMIYGHRSVRNKVLFGTKPPRYQLDRERGEGSRTGGPCLRYLARTRTRTQHQHSTQHTAHSTQHTARSLIHSLTHSLTHAHSPQCLASPDEKARRLCPLPPPPTAVPCGPPFNRAWPDLGCPPRPSQSLWPSQLPPGESIRDGICSTRAAAMICPSARSFPPIA